MHIFFSAHNYMYAHTLAHCRLVLNAYNFTMFTVFYIKFCVFIPNRTTISGPLFELIDPNNIQKTKFQML